MSDNNTKPKKRGRPRVEGRKIRITFRVREGRSVAEDNLFDRLEQLPQRQRSRFIRRVLTTGDIDPILDREFARESEWAATSLAGLGSWGDEEED
jgi:hypothetical protein